MKRWFSLFVTLCLMLTMLPGTALGAETQTATEQQTAELQQPLEEAPAAEQPNPVQEIWMEPERFDGEVETLAAGAAQISGTVSLPAGASVLADSYLYVYACNPPVLDEATGKVLVEADPVRSCRVNFSKGQSSGSYTITGLEPGDYVLRVYSYLAGDRLLGGDLYFSADGTYVGNMYAATKLAVSSGSSVNLTLPLAERWISGTVTVDSPVAEDTGIRLSCYDDTMSGSYTSMTTIQKGQTQAEFSIGVGQGSYSLQLSDTINWNYKYSDVYGTVSNNYSDRMAYTTLEGPVTDLKINVTNLLTGGEDEETGSQVEVTVMLPEPLTEEREFAVSLVNVTEYSEYFSNMSSIVLKEGTQSFTLEVSGVQGGNQFKVGYSDVTDCGTRYVESAGIRFAAENGVTTLVSKAKVFTGGIDTQVTITEPACDTISGTLSRSGAVLPQQAAYVTARFGDGEAYASRVVFGSEESQASYTIYVPQSQKGNTFTLSVAPAGGGVSNQVNSESETVIDTLTFTGAMVKNLALPEQEANIFGTIFLPQGVTAPKDGLVVEVGLQEEYQQTQYATYYLPAGQSSFQYALSGPETGGVTVWASLVGSVDGVYQTVKESYSQAQLTQADLTFSKAVTVSGNVTVPEGCRDGVAVVQIMAQMGSDTNSEYISFNVGLPKGTVSVPYRLKLPTDMLLSRLYVEVSADTQDALNTQSMYLQPDLKTFANGYQTLDVSLTEDLELDIPLSKGLFVSGTLSLSPGLEAGAYSGRIYLEPVNGGQAEEEYFDFEGISYNYKIPLSQAAVGQQYYLCIYPYGGPGIIPYEYSYYSVNGMTSDKAAATPITIGADGAQVDLTIPKGKIISGSLVSADGGAVTWDREGTLWMYLKSEDGQSVSDTVTIDDQGNWSMTVSPSLSGQFRLHTYISSGGGTNIIGNQNYYYAQNGVATSESDAGFLTIGAEDVTGVKLYVETGWVLSGQLKLPAGGYVTGGEVDMTLWAEGESSSYRGDGTVGASGGSYSITVPKESGTYTIRLNGTSSIPDGVTTNVYLSGEQKLTGVEVSGDVSGLDFTLEKGRSTITGTVYRPDEMAGDQYFNLSVYVDTAEGGYYHTNVSMSYNKNSAAFSLVIPESDASQTYSFSYSTYNTNGLANGTFYMAQDGSMTNDYSQRGIFSLAEPCVHDFTPLTILPIATGKIYCPEELTAPITLMVDTMPASGVSAFDVTDSVREVTIGPGIGQQDENGRWYSTYSLGNSDLVSGSGYWLSYYSNDVSDVVDTGSHYVNSDGTVVSSAEEAYTYYVPYSGTNQVDFTPILWDDGAEDYVLQSDHGFTGLDQAATYTYTCPGATSLEVTFSSRTDCFVKVNGTRYNPYDLAGETITVTGDTLTVELETISQGMHAYYGFAVEQVTANGVTDVQPGAAAAYTASGSDSQSILEDIQRGEPLHLTLVGIKNMRLLAAAAIYDENGALLDIALAEVYSESGSWSASMQFDEAYGQTATVKVFLADGFGIPMMKNLTFQEQS